MRKAPHYFPVHQRPSAPYLRPTSRPTLRPFSPFSSAILPIWPSFVFHMNTCANMQIDINNDDVDDDNDNDDDDMDKFVRCFSIIVPLSLLILLNVINI